ncbi:hypothetical protein NMY22_g4280 [Coprinellus aureogranulatus]|nr:hypothetical protein NMY22_g4280 [Coprinellus aureogranulatus]
MPTSRDHSPESQNVPSASGSPTPARKRDRFFAFFRRSPTPQPTVSKLASGSLSVTATHAYTSGEELAPDESDPAEGVPSPSLDLGSTSLSIAGQIPFNATSEVQRPKSPGLSTVQHPILSGELDHSEGASAVEPPVIIPPPSSGIKVALNFTQTLLKKLPDILDMGNPAKVVLGVAQTIIEIKEVVQDNMDAVDRRIASTGTQLHIVKTAIERYQDGESHPAMQKFQETLGQELGKLYQLKDGSAARKVADHEDEKNQIAEIFENVNEARERFQLEAGIRMYEKVDSIQQALKLDLRSLESLPKHPDVSGQRSEYFANSRDGETEYVLSWTEASSTLVLSIHAAAGMGKSTFAHHLGKELRSRKQLAASLFMSFVPPDWGPETLVRLIAGELGRIHPEAVPAIVEAIHTCSGSSLTMQQLFDSYICRPLLALRLGTPLIVVLDAFDEWKPHATFSKELIHLEPIRHLVKFVVLGRAELRSNDIKGVSIHSYSLPPASRSVMRCYFQTQLASVEWDGDKLEAHEADQLADKSNGWFVWASTVCSTMKDDFSEASPRQILEETLHSQLTIGHSDTLSELYKGTILRSFPTPRERKFMHKFIQAITVLKGLRALQTREPDESDKLVYPFGSSFHLSVAEFFQGESPMGDPSLNISIPASHEMMALACLHLLPKLFPPSDEVASEHHEAVARYAIQNWPTHVTGVGTPADPNVPVDWSSIPVLVRLHDIGWETVHRWGQSLLRFTIKREDLLLEIGFPPPELWRLLVYFGDCMLTTAILTIARGPGVACHQIAVQLCPSAVLTWCSFGMAHVVLSEIIYSPESCKKGITFIRHALQLEAAMGVETDDESDPKGTLASTIESGFVRYGGQVIGRTDIEEAISFLEGCLQHRPRGHDQRSEALRNLARCYRSRFGIGGVVEDLERALQLEREALELRPEGHRDRSQSLNNLASSLHQHFGITNDLHELEESIQLHREALELRPDGHLDRPQSLNNLANSLRDHFEMTKDLQKLDEAIHLHREALKLRPDGHPERIDTVNNLAIFLLGRSRVERHDRASPNNPNVSPTDCLLARLEWACPTPPGHYPYPDVVDSEETPRSGLPTSSLHSTSSVPLKSSTPSTSSVPLKSSTPSASSVPLKSSTPSTSSVTVTSPTLLTASGTIPSPTQSTSSGPVPPLTPPTSSVPVSSSFSFSAPVNPSPLPASSVRSDYHLPSDLPASNDSMQVNTLVQPGPVIQRYSPPPVTPAVQPKPTTEFPSLVPPLPVQATAPLNFSSPQDVTLSPHLLSGVATTFPTQLISGTTIAPPQEVLTEPDHSSFRFSQVTITPPQAAVPQPVHPSSQIAQTSIAPPRYQFHSQSAHPLKSFRRSRLLK